MNIFQKYLPQPDSVEIARMNTISSIVRGNVYFQSASIYSDADLSLLRKVASTVDAQKKFKEILEFETV